MRLKGQDYIILKKGLSCTLPVKCVTAVGVGLHVNRTACYVCGFGEMQSVCVSCLECSCSLTHFESHSFTRVS